MRTADAASRFGGIKPLATAMNVKPRTVESWGEFPPLPRQYQIEILTHGELRAEREWGEA